jgi:transcriptional regulator with XRE-family HTH domain
MQADEQAKTPSLADKLDHLFSVVHPAKGEYTYDHVSKAIKSRGGPTVSAAYIWQLRKGVRDNPTKRHLEALADFFGVPPSYFFDEDDARRVDAELELLAAMRDAGVRQVALRATGLSPQSLAAITAMIEHARQLEGLSAHQEAGPTGS